MRVEKTFTFIILFTRLCRAATFCIDPQSGSMDGNGSFSDPWSTLEEVITLNKIQTQEWESYPYEPARNLTAKNSGAPVKGGDTLLLRTGYHGEVTIRRHYNTQAITIAPQEGHTPTLKRLTLQACAKWTVQGLTISPENAPVYERVQLLHIESHRYSGPSREITVENCNLYSVAQASSWSADDWDTKSCNALSVSGNQCVIRNNLCKNVNFGISVSGDSCLIEGNVVENFAGDGLRGLGDDLTFLHNTVKNCYDVNGNHDDGFQSWSTGVDGVGSGTVYRLKLIGNTIINYDDPNQPHRGTLQGIGCFDGMFEDWVVENNVIIVDHWHGITLSGATNCRVVNNTVCDRNTGGIGPPWIRIAKNKDSHGGTPATGCIVQNNLCQSFQVDSSGCIALSHNLRFSSPGEMFTDFAQLNVHLQEGCAAIDAGTDDYAPNRDIDGTERPLGEAVDIGAYEFNPDRERVPYAPSCLPRSLNRRIKTLPDRVLMEIATMPDKHAKASLVLFDSRGSKIACIDGIRCGRYVRYTWLPASTGTRMVLAQLFLDNGRGPVEGGVFRLTGN